MLSRRFIMIVVACSFLGCCHAYAVTTSWNTDVSGTFTTAANWDNGVPDSDDTAVFNRGAGVAYTVTFPGGSVLDPPPNYVISDLSVRSNEVTFADNSSQFITSPSLSVANPGVSTIIGQDAGDVAILTTSLSSLSGGNASIGRNAGSNGTLNVSAGAFIMSGGLDVGDSGTGTLNVTAGGSVSNTFGFLGYDPGSNGTAIINGAGSIWFNNGRLTVGSGGMGTLTIEAGGSVGSTSGSLGASFGGHGTATVTGVGSSWTIADTLSVGNGVNGTLTVENGGFVSVGDLNFFSGSTVNLNGGTLRMDTYNRFGTAVFNFNSGTIELTSNRRLGTDPAIRELFGVLPTIPAGKGLTVDNTATIETAAARSMPRQGIRPDHREDRVSGA